MFNAERALVESRTCKKAVKDKNLSSNHALEGGFAFELTDKPTMDLQSPEVFMGLAHNLFQLFTYYGCG